MEWVPMGNKGKKGNEGKMGVFVLFYYFELILDCAPLKVGKRTIHLPIYFLHHL